MLRDIGLCLFCGSVEAPGGCNHAFSSVKTRHRTSMTLLRSFSSHQSFRHTHVHVPYPLLQFYAAYSPLKQSIMQISYSMLCLHIQQNMPKAWLVKSATRIEPPYCHTMSRIKCLRRPLIHVQLLTYNYSQCLSLALKSQQHGVLQSYPPRRVELHVVVATPRIAMLDSAMCFKFMCMMLKYSRYGTCGGGFSAMA